MGRIVAQVTVVNPLDATRQIRFEALVDTGFALLVLPTSWKDRLGSFYRSSSVEMELANQTPARCEVCGPVEITVEGFRPTQGEVAFIDMAPADGGYEPLLGYLSLEAAGIAVDMLGHRLVQAKRLDLK